MNFNDAKSNLKEMTDAIKSLELRYFLTDGTLLGAMREKDFIGHDLDIDFGVFAEEIDIEKLRVLRGELESAGFELVHSYGDFINNYQLTFQKRSINVDLFFYREFEDKYIFHAFWNGKPITYFYKKDIIGGLSEMEFLGDIYSAPEIPEKLLEAKYGEWKKQETKWDWAFSPKNIYHPNVHVVTVGCFDLLHEGHINLFNKMSEKIGWEGYNNPYFHVILHDDYSIFQNKGRFPVQNTGHRKYNLEQLGIFPIVTSDKDPSETIKTLVEKIGNCMFMRGDDWQDFPGKKMLEELNIPIDFIGYTKEVSSTLIRKDL